MSDTALVAAERLANGGDVETAIKVLLTERAKENPPQRQLAIHGMLGDLYSMEFETDRAVAEYDAILNIMPQLELAHFKKATALKQVLTRESQDAAIASLRESYRFGHAGCEVFSGLGFCYKMLADFGLVTEAEREDCLKQAKENFLQSLEMDPEHCHALLHLADLEFNAGNFKDAQEHYCRLSALSPGDPMPLVRMAHAMHTSGNPQGALVSLQRALDRISAIKKSPVWKRNIERNIALRETEVDCHLYRAEVLRALSDTQEARKEYEAVLSLTAPGKQDSVSMDESVTMKMKSCRERALKMLIAV